MKEEIYKNSKENRFLVIYNLINGVKNFYMEKKNMIYLVDNSKLKLEKIKIYK